MLDGVALKATLVDLPAVVESHKTLDKAHFYKTCDLAQVLCCLMRCFGAVLGGCADGCVFSMRCHD